jgi:hypothetical protein
MLPLIYVLDTVSLRSIMECLLTWDDGKHVSKDACHGNARH